MSQGTTALQSLLDPKTWTPTMTSPARHVRTVDDHRLLEAARAELSGYRAREAEVGLVFQWLYRALLALAERNLKESQNDRGEWPCDQEWTDLVGSSHSIFLHRARDEAGIPHEEFLERVRSLKGEYDVNDLYERASELGVSAALRGDAEKGG